MTPHFVSVQTASLEVRPTFTGLWAALGATIPVNIQVHTVAVSISDFCKDDFLFASCVHLSCVVLLGHHVRFNIEILAAIIAHRLFSSHVNRLVYLMGLRLQGPCCWWCLARACADVTTSTRLQTMSLYFSNQCSMSLAHFPCLFLQALSQYTARAVTCLCVPIIHIPDYLSLQLFILTLSTETIISRRGVWHLFLTQSPRS